MLLVLMNILNQSGGHLKTLYDKGLIYQDYKIVPQCPKSETVLSSHELALGYKDTKDPSVYVLMKLEDSELSKDGDTLFPRLDNNTMDTYFQRCISSWS